MTDAIRESFEAWAKSQRICVDRDPRGGYVWRSSQTVWEAWQAAIADQPAQGEAVAWRYESPSGDCFYTQSHVTQNSDWKVTPLYTAPPAPRATGATDGDGYARWAQGTAAPEVPK